MNNLLNLQPVKNSSNFSGLRELHDQCDVNIRSLQNLGVTSGSYGHLLNPILMKLLPQDMMLDFHRKCKPKRGKDVSELLIFLRNEIKCREVISAVYNSCSSSKVCSDSRAKPNNGQKQNPRFGKGNISTMTLNTSQNVLADKLFWIFCKSHNNHFSNNCDVVTDNVKKQILKKEYCCYKCFRKNHLSAECRSKIDKCNFCNEFSHNKLFCKLSQTSSNNSNTNTLVSLTQSETSNEFKATLLQICIVAISANSGKELVCCFIDPGSERTFLTRKLVNSLKLKPIRKEKLMIYFGQHKPQEIIYDVVSVKLRSIFNSSSLKIEALVTDVITCAKLKQAPRDLHRLLCSQGYKLCDPKRKDETGILLGSYYAWQTMRGEVKQLPGGLFISETIFGHTVQGPLESENFNSTAGVHFMSTADAELNNEINKFWSLESLGIIANEVNNSDLAIVKDFEDNLKFVDGRYETKLLWKPHELPLSNNFKIAEYRFENLKPKLYKNEWLLENYNAIMLEQLRDGVIESCKSETRETKSYYMPHRPEVRKEKSTTKVRIVYDASSKSINCNSLNECLDSGPNLNPTILDVILKFRKNKIGFSADIEKAFLQIKIAEEDRDYLTFLYFENCDSSKETKSYGMTRVPFGVTSSPFILASAIKYHIKKYEKSNYETYNMLNTSLYVDDLFFGSETVESAVKLSTEAVPILKEAGLELMPLLDMLQKPLKCSKRVVLQTAAKCFDPAGFISPFLIRIKCIVQELWEMGLDWDETFNAEMRKK
ncbi:uncharacterized protein LOC129234261 [Uloborus diversus]|uniref:uncharacterized protein LOC129234261 n=1 Tax=Uloborus diversus TaxID=327109 RepID=UPI002408F820|nr:uncharacterized protein LOC129234261 [Uloborus diversus]